MQLVPTVHVRHFSLVGSWSHRLWKSPAAAVTWLSQPRNLAGMDGNRTHPGRLNSAPQTVLKTGGGTSPRTSPAGKMLFRQRDADALDAQRLGVPGKEADQEAQHAIDLRGPGDGG